MKNIDILGVGCVAVDDVIKIKNYPLPDEKVKVIENKRELGGLIGRALLTASNVGASCAYYGTLGYGPNSQFVLEQFRKSNINIDLVDREKNAGPFYSTAIVAEKESTRNVFYNKSKWVSKYDINDGLINYICN